MHNQNPLALAGPMREYFDRGQTLELARRAGASPNVTNGNEKLPDRS